MIPGTSRPAAILSRSWLHSYPAGSAHELSILRPTTSRVQPDSSEFGVMHKILTEFAVQRIRVLLLGVAFFAFTNERLVFAVPQLSNEGPLRGNQRCHNRRCQSAVPCTVKCCTKEFNDPTIEDLLAAGMELSLKTNDPVAKYFSGTYSRRNSDITRVFGIFPLPRGAKGFLQLRSEMQTQQDGLRQELNDWKAILGFGY